MRALGVRLLGLCSAPAMRIQSELLAAVFFATSPFLHLTFVDMV